MNIKGYTSIYAFALSLLALNVYAGEQGQLIRATSLKAKPFLDSAVVSELAANTALSIQKREGAWMQVKASGKEGWVKMLSVRTTAPTGTDSGLRAMQQLAKTGSTGTAITTGVKSTLLGDVKPATGAINENELNALDRLAVSDAEAEAFALAIQLDPILLPEAGKHPLVQKTLFKVQRLIKRGDTFSSDEKEHSRALAGRLLSSYLLIQHPTGQQYVNKIGQWIALHSQRSALAWRFGLIESPDIQSFSTPAGHVFLTRGLVNLLRTETELAGALAYEIARVERGSIQHALKTGGWSEEKAGLVFTQGIMSAEEETKIDALAIELAAKAGYHPYGLAHLLNTLGGIQTKEPTLKTWAALHPAPAARLNALNESLSKYDELIKTTREDWGRLETHLKGL